MAKLSKREKIYKFISENPYCYLPDIKKAMPYRSINHHITTLLFEKRIRRIGDVRKYQYYVSDVKEIGVSEIQ